jgi:hypothetical protein
VTLLLITTARWRRWVACAKVVNRGILSDQVAQGQGEDGNISGQVRVMVNARRRTRYLRQVIAKI